LNEWIVRIEGATQATGGDDAAEALLDAPAAFSPAVSYGHGRIAATLTVSALTPQEAVAQALDAFVGVTVSHVEADRAA
jgi:hypothetical protein